MAGFTDLKAKQAAAPDAPTVTYNAEYNSYRVEHGLNSADVGQNGFTKVHRSTSMIFGTDISREQFAEELKGLSDRTQSARFDPKIDRDDFQKALKTGLENIENGTKRPEPPALTNVGLDGDGQLRMTHGKSSLADVDGKIVRGGPKDPKLENDAIGVCDPAQSVQVNLSSRITDKSPAMKSFCSGLKNSP